MRSLKILLLSAFMVLVSNTLSAQKMGIRAGVNLSTISGDYANSINQTGYYAGIYKEIPLVKSLLFIQPEIQYSSQGFSNDIADYKLDYITVPVLAKVYVVKLLSFETGPQFGFKINDKSDPNNPLIDPDFDFETFDPAWAFGASLNLPFGLSINSRFISSFNSVFKDANYNDQGKSQVFQVGAAFQF
ncbi:porin family protein [Flavobacterium taihuense]|uniref:PorT family protein n=1 Tax=Flavobacterium taihuense TaxID=2857508 RepID=A0ABS6XR80_9FLAO|nr:porin family protein [Flavobacterium taihuense]MBW4359187.1 PorT family protein [Flavobacterium taihuense]